jgi:hypothetical protein
MWNPRVSGSGNAKLSTAFDVIRRFILLFAWDMPEFGFIGTAVTNTFPSMCDSPYLRAGCTLQLGSGNLTILMSTIITKPQARAHQASGCVEPDILCSWPRAKQFSIKNKIVCYNMPIKQKIYSDYKTRLKGPIQYHKDINFRIQISGK